MKLKRVYRPWDEWEEVPANMWGEVELKEDALQLAIRFTSNHIEYGKAMIEVINKWPISCENALTDPNLNRRAWVGHAACAFKHRIPEYITRLAWGYLSSEQQLLANREAERAIREWELSYYKDSGLHQDLGGQMLFDGYS